MMINVVLNSHTPFLLGEVGEGRNGRDGERGEGGVGDKVKVKYMFIVLYPS